MGNNVANVNEEQNVALFGDARPDYVQGNGRGSEGVGTDDLSLPRLSIIQDMSPQRKKDKPEYIEGASEGMAFNTASNKLFTKPILFVPCFFRSEYVAWKDRDAGGGFGGAFPTQEKAEDWINSQENPDQWDVTYTHQHFGLMVHPDHTEAKPHLEDVVISMSRSQLKPSRKLNTMIQQDGGDRFARAYRMSVVQDRSEKGEFYNWKPEQLGYVPEDIYKRGEKVYEAVSSGARDVSRSDEGRAERVDPNDM